MCAPTVGVCLCHVGQCPRRFVSGFCVIKPSRVSLNWIAELLYLELLKSYIDGNSSRRITMLIITPIFGHFYSFYVNVHGT